MEINTLVAYGANGICRIEGMSEQMIDGVCRRFYVLRPVESESSTIYVPTDSEMLCKKMKPLLTPSEALDLIQTMPESETLWITDDRERNERYHNMIADGNCSELVRLTKTLYQRKQYLAKFGKKLRSADDRILQQAEKILFGELAVVLGIPRSEVLAFIEEKLVKTAAEEK